jgi:MFS family permease
MSLQYTFSAFVATFELGSLLCGVATSSKMLIVGRAVAGIGGSGIVNGALTIISACVPLHKRAGKFSTSSSNAALPLTFLHSFFGVYDVV